MNGKLLHFYYSYLWGFDTADRLDAADKDLAVLEQRMQEKLKPYEAQLTLLDEIPGVDWSVTAAIIAELGVDMSVFQSVLQATSWAGVSPGQDSSVQQKLKARRGYKRAVVAVAHKILVAIYHMLSHQVCYNELGELYLDKLKAYLDSKPGSSPATFRLHRHIGAKGRMTSVPLAHTGCQLNPIFIAAGVRKLSAENR